jgi:hypothetical protein
VTEVPDEGDEVKRRSCVSVSMLSNRPDICPADVDRSPFLLSSMFDLRLDCQRRIMPATLSLAKQSLVLRLAEQKDER